MTRALDGVSSTDFNTAKERLQVVCLFTDIRYCRNEGIIREIGLYVKYLDLLPVDSHIVSFIVGICKYI